MNVESKHRPTRRRTTSPWCRGRTGHRHKFTGVERNLTLGTSKVICTNCGKAQL